MSPELTPQEVELQPSIGSSPATAQIGATQLVIWSDSRRVWANYRRENGAFDLYATVLDVGSHSPDLPARPLVIARGNQLFPALATNGALYLLVWTDELGDAVSLRAMRLDAGGRPLDPVPLDLGTSARRPARLASLGSDFVVVWSDDRGDGEAVFATEVTLSGHVRYPGGRRITSPHLGASYAPRLTAGPGGYLAVWTDTRSTASGAKIYGARLDASGARVGDELAIAVAPNRVRLDPHVVFAAGSFVVTWSQTQGLYDYDVMGSRVTPEGLVLDPEGVPVVTGPTRAFAAAMTSTVDGVWLTWIEQAGQQPAWVGMLDDRLGLVGDPRPMGDRTRQVTWTVASEPPRFVAVHHDETVVAGALPPDHAPISAAAVAVAANRQLEVSIAAGAGGYLVAWYDTHTPPGVYAMRVDAAGRMLDPTPRRIARVNVPRTWPAVASSASGWLVVWEDRSPASDDVVYAVRLASDGAVLDELPITISTGAGTAAINPDVAFDGDNFMVVWEDYREDWYARLYMSRVASDGRVLDPDGTPVAPGSAEQFDPRIEAGEGQVAIVWNESSTPGEDAIAGVWLGAQPGLPGTPFTVTEPHVPVAVTSTSLDGGALHVAWSAWNDGIQAASYVRTMVPGDPSGGATVPLGDEVVGLAHDGVSLVASVGSPAVPGSGRLLRIDEEGVGPTVTIPEGAVLASGRSGQIAVGYTRFDERPAVQAPRVFVRFAALPP